MVNAQVALAVEEPTGEARAGEPGEDDGPITGLLAGDGKLERAAGGGAGGAGVPVEVILGQAGEGFESEFGGEGTGGEGAAVGEVGKGEVCPGGDEPVAVAVVEEFGGMAVGVGEIGVEVGGAAEGFEGGGIIGMLPVDADSGEGEGVVAEGGRVRGLFAPEAVRVLFADEAGEDAAAEGGLVGDVEDFAAEEDGGGEEGVVVGGGA